MAPAMPREDDALAEIDQDPVAHVLGDKAVGALPENAMERVDIATEQIGFPDGAEGGPAVAPSLRATGCRAPGRDRRARSPIRALQFSSRTKQNSALCVAGTDCGLGGLVHAALMQGVVLPEN
jgi:hypothetical protein